MEEIKILSRTEDVIVCVKPTGVLSQRGRPGQETMVTALSAQLGGEVYPVHRLDRETGGLMVYGASEQAAARLSRSLQQGQLEKEYLAVVQGCPEPSQGGMRDLLFHDQRRNKTYVVDRLRKGVKEARLFYRVLEERDGLSLVQVRLLTGRTHQIRVQFASRGWPLLGDRRYGGPSGVLGLWAMRLRLPGKDGTQSFAALPEGGLGLFQTLTLPEPMEVKNFQKE